MSLDYKSYRRSHTKSGCGKHYQKTYTAGYYAALWNKIEKPIVKELFENLKSSGATSCLDFACGTGRIAGVAENYFHNVVGVDVSAEMLSVANTVLSKTTLLKQDLTTDPIDEMFDVITCFRFFLNAESELSVAALQSQHRMLSANGTLIINVHVNRYSILGRAYRLRNFFSRRVIAKTLDLELFTKTLQNTGFLVIETKWYGYYPRTGWVFGSIAKICLLPVEWFCNATKIVPKCWAQNFIVICKKMEC